MKKLALTLLMFVAVGCATPYATVDSVGERGYYLPEAPPSLSYGYGGGISYWDYGFYPWWSTAGYYGYWSYPFFYYSPNFYPHYFSVWSPGWHHYHYGWGRSWHTPYRHVQHDPVVIPVTPGDTSDRPPRRVVAPVPIRSRKAYPLPGRLGPRTDPGRFSDNSVAEPIVSPAAGSWPQRSAGAARSASSSNVPAPRSARMSPPAGRSAHIGGDYRDVPRSMSAPSPRVNAPRGRYSKRDGH